MPPVRTNIMEIGRACIARLNLLKVVEDPAQILWSARKGELPHVKGKKDLVVRPRRGQDIKAFAQGGGRYGMVCIRTIDFILRTSSALDHFDTDEAWLDEHTLFEDAVLNALAEQMLVNLEDDTEEYLTCPLKYLGTTEETRGDNQKPQLLWGSSQISLEAHFKPKLDVTQIA